MQSSADTGNLPLCMFLIEARQHQSMGHIAMLLWHCTSSNKPYWKGNLLFQAPHQATALGKPPCQLVASFKHGQKMYLSAPNHTDTYTIQCLALMSVWPLAHPLHISKSLHGCSFSHLIFSWVSYLQAVLFHTITPPCAYLFCRSLRTSPGSLCSPVRPKDSPCYNHRSLNRECSRKCSQEFLTYKALRIKPIGVYLNISSKFRLFWCSEKLH